MEQKSTQDYLKAVYGLAKNGDLVSTNEISQKLEVAPASVTEMLKKLSQDGYIKYSPYHGSTLTEKGLQQAQESNPKTSIAGNFPLRHLAYWKRQGSQGSLPNGACPLRRSRRIPMPPPKTPRHMLR